MTQSLTHGNGPTANGQTAFQARLLDAVEQAVIATDLEGRIVFWNRFAEKLYGWTAEEVLGKTVQELTPSATTIEEAREIIRRLSKGETWRGEFEVQRKDGSTFIAYVADSAVYDDEDQIGVVGVSMDITEAKRQAEQREELIQSLEREHRLVVELSSPILRIADRALLLPLIGLIDDRRADLVSDSLLNAIRDERARKVVLDVTGVGKMNRTVADWLVRTVLAARMLGAEVLLTGVSTPVAHALVSLGTDVSGLTVVGDLQAGLDLALRKDDSRGAKTVGFNDPPSSDDRDG